MGVVVIVAVAVVLLILAFSMLVLSHKSDSDWLIDYTAKYYSKNKQSPLYQWVINELKSIDKDFVGKTNENSFLQSFKISCKDKIKANLHATVEKCGTSWLGAPPTLDEYDQVEVSICMKDIINRAIDYIFDTADIENKLFEIFMDSIKHNISLADIIEQEAIDYNKSFGIEPEGDPELHPRKTNSDDYESSEIVEKSLTELSSTGTVEDINDD